MPCLLAGLAADTTPLLDCRSRTAVAPLERLKILMQVQGAQKTYTGVWQARQAVQARACLRASHPQC